MLLSATALALLPLRGFSQRRGRQLRVNGERLNRLMRELREFGKTPAGGVSRVAYSDADIAARAYIMDRMREAGLSIRVDTAGNILGRREGREPLPPLLMGSHIDSVPDGGAYDGNVGSLGALEAAWTLADNDVTTRHPIEVVIFQNEEGAVVGSEAMGGTLDVSELDRVSQSGVTIGEGMQRLGGDPDRLHEAVRPAGTIAAYLELHIEQGGFLERDAVDIGVVEGIVGIRWWDVTVDGFANHAGTTPMDQRRDALLAGAKFVQAVNRIITSTPGRQVGTVGRIEALPGAPNVIPGQVQLSLEIRDLDAAKIGRLFERIRAEAGVIEDDTGTKIGFTDKVEIVPAPTDPRIRNVIDEVATALGLTHQRMPSGAGHDAQSIAPVAPIGMMFIPSVGGISHSPKEFSEPQDIMNGANVLLNTLLRLDDMRL